MAQEQKEKSMPMPIIIDGMTFPQIKQELERLSTLFTSLCQMATKQISLEISAARPEETHLDHALIANILLLKPSLKLIHSRFIQQNFNGLCGADDVLCDYLKTKDAFEVREAAMKEREQVEFMKTLKRNSDNQTPHMKQMITDLGFLITKTPLPASSFSPPCISFASDASDATATSASSIVSSESTSTKSSPIKLKKMITPQDVVIQPVEHIKAVKPVKPVQPTEMCQVIYVDGKLLDLPKKRMTMALVHSLISGYATSVPLEDGTDRIAICDEMAITRNRGYNRFASSYLTNPKVFLHGPVIICNKRLSPL